MPLPTARHRHRRAPVFLGMIAAVLPAIAQVQDDVAGSADDAFGSRIGQESIGLYSESMVRGFDLQQAGNYRIGDAYFVRAAAPTDAIVASSQIRVGASALPIDFPAPSGIVQYTLLPGDRERGRLEFGFQHLLDSNPRPYLRGFFTRRSDDGRFSLSGGLLGSPSARYMFGNEARYYGVGLVPRLRLGDHWQLTGFYGLYHQRYQADVGFVAADGVRLPQIERLRYLGQAWSRYDTRNVTSGAIAASDPRDNAWDYRCRPCVHAWSARAPTSTCSPTSTTRAWRPRRPWSRATAASIRKRWKRSRAAIGPTRGSATS